MHDYMIDTMAIPKQQLEELGFIEIKVGRVKRS